MKHSHCETAAVQRQIPVIATLDRLGIVTGILPKVLNILSS